VGQVILCTGWLLVWVSAWLRSIVRRGLAWMEGRVRSGLGWSLRALITRGGWLLGEDDVDDALVRTRRRWTGHPRNTRSSEAPCFPAPQFASTAVCCWRRHRHLASHQCIKLKNRRAGGRPLVQRTVGLSGAYLVAGQIEHAQEPAGGFCVDEDWTAGVELGAKGLRSSRRRARRSTAQRTGQGHENVANRKPYHRRGRR